MRQRFASATTRPGMVSIDAWVMKSTTALVAPWGDVFAAGWAISLVPAWVSRAFQGVNDPAASSRRNSWRVMTRSVARPLVTLALSLSKDGELASPLSLPPPVAPLQQWREEHLDVLPQARGGGTVAIDRPLQQRPAHHRLHGAREPRGIAWYQSAGHNRVVEQPFHLGVHRAGMREGVGVKLGIGEIHLQKGEAVRERFRRDRHRRHALGGRVDGGDG